MQASSRARDSLISRRAPRRPPPSLPQDSTAAAKPALGTAEGPARERGRTRCRSKPTEPLVERLQHLVDPVADGVLGHRPTARVVADRAGLVGMGEVMVELSPELGQVVVGDDLFAR